MWGRVALRTNIRAVNDLWGGEGIPRGSLIGIHGPVMEARILAYNLIDLREPRRECCILTICEDEQHFKEILERISKIEGETYIRQLTSPDELDEIGDYFRGRSVIIVDSLSDMKRHWNWSIKELGTFLRSIRALSRECSAVSLALFYPGAGVSAYDSIWQELIRWCDAVIELRKETIHAAGGPLGEGLFMAVHPGLSGALGKRTPYTFCLSIHGLGIVVPGELIERAPRKEELLKYNEDNSAVRGEPILVQIEDKSIRVPVNRYQTLKLPVKIEYDDGSLDYIYVPTNRLVSVIHDRSTVEFYTWLSILTLYALKDGFPVLYVAIDEIPDIFIYMSWEVIDRRRGEDPFVEASLMKWARRKDGPDEEMFKEVVGRTGWGRLSILDWTRTREQIPRPIRDVIYTLEEPEDLDCLYEFIIRWCKEAVRLVEKECEPFTITVHEGAVIILDSLAGLSSLYGFERSTKFLETLANQLLSRETYNRIILNVVPKKAFNEEQLLRIEHASDCIIELGSTVALRNPLKYMKLRGAFWRKLVKGASGEEFIAGIKENVPFLYEEFEYPVGILSLRPETVAEMIERGLLLRARG
ncbi:MAG: hypothetical protein DRN61_06795 [Thaumarchaeota archaeon]|nr:MAG: hypothetical protein DRN61_06795 [Nitrososphaerota archaeon]